MVQPLAVESQWQRAAGIDDSIEAATENWEKYSGGSGKYEQIRTFIANSHTTLQWLTENGAVFDSVQPDISVLVKLLEYINSPPLSAHPLVQWINFDYAYLDTEVTSIEQKEGYYTLNTTENSGI